LRPFPKHRPPANLDARLRSQTKPTKKAKSPPKKSTGKAERGAPTLKPTGAKERENRRDFDALNQAKRAQDRKSPRE
jgi:hypothetical protein